MSMLALFQSELLLSCVWVAYALLSATAVYYVKRTFSRPFSVCFALALSAIDVLAPFTYTLPRQQVSALVVPFLMALPRPWKILAYTFEFGPLHALPSLRDHLAVANLPVMPLNCLPEHVQRRMKVYKLGYSRISELLVSAESVVLASILLRLFSAEECSYCWRRLLHGFAFVSYTSLVFNGAAALASTIASDTVLITPFNDCWLATSVADWWNYRWDTIVSLTLRMGVFDPIHIRCQALMGRKGASIVAGMATFSASALLHEYAMVAQGQPQAIGYVWAYFMIQPILIGLEPVLRKCTDLFASAIRIPLQKSWRDRYLTISLIIVPIYYLWAPVYDPPIGTLNDASADSVLRLLGLCEVVPNCLTL